MPSVSLKPTLNPHKFHFSKYPYHNFPSPQLYFSRSASHSKFPSSLLSFPNSYNSCSLSLTKKCYCKVGSYEHWVSSLFFSFTTKKGLSRRFKPMCSDSRYRVARPIPALFKSVGITPNTFQTLFWRLDLCRDSPDQQFWRPVPADFRAYTCAF